MSGKNKARFLNGDRDLEALKETDKIKFSFFFKPK